MFVQNLGHLNDSVFANLLQTGGSMVTIVRRLRKIPPLFLRKEEELAFVPREVTYEAYHLVGFF